VIENRQEGDQGAESGKPGILVEVFGSQHGCAPCYSCCIKKYCPVRKMAKPVRRNASFCLFSVYNNSLLQIPVTFIAHLM
jgi:hypothetical protein